MAYAELVDVQALVPEFQVTDTSRPNTAEVTSMITMVEAEINGVLSAQGYETIPATGSNDVPLLRGYVSRKVGAWVLEVAYARSSNEQSGKVSTWNNDYREFLARLRRSEQHLIDQSPQGDNEPVFGVLRHPTRDDHFTYRTDSDDWDE